MGSVLDPIIIIRIYISPAPLFLTRMNLPTLKMLFLCIGILRLNSLPPEVLKIAP